VIDFASIVASALDNADILLRELFPQGRRQGREFCVGNIDGGAGSSLKVSLDTGAWKDFANGEKGGGDLVSLWARVRGCENGAAAREIAERLGMNGANGNGRHPAMQSRLSSVSSSRSATPSSPSKSSGGTPMEPRASLTLREFADAKGFTTEFLTTHGVVEEKSALVFQYKLMSAQCAVRQRIRRALAGGKRFIWNSTKGKPVPYGLWRLDEARKRGIEDLFVVEGESDTLTLWLYGEAVIGIPGADMWATLNAPYLAGFKRVFVVRENDGGGETFEKGGIARLTALEFDGAVAVIEMERAEIKDPNELHLKMLGDAGGFESEWRALVEQARSVKLPRVGILLTNLADVAPTRTDWFWKDRIPLGNTTLVAGMPGVGKSTMMWDLVARASTGAAFPDGAPGFGPARILIVTGEDNVSSTIVPRLSEFAADLSRIDVIRTVAVQKKDGEIGERGFNLSEDLPALEKTLAHKPDIRLIIIDPLMSFLGGTDAHKESEMRGFVMTPLFTLAEKYNLAIVIVVHLNKGSGSPLQRISGSVGIAGAARMVWACAADPKSENQRTLLLPVKFNLAKDIGGLAFTVVSSKRDADIATIEWEDGAVYTKVAEVFAEEAERRSGALGGNKLEAAILFLREMLANGPRPVVEIENRAKALGISERTLDRARWKLDVQRWKKGFSGGWVVSLPVDSSRARGGPVE
jgi:putative DNA primase/helicase